MPSGTMISIPPITAMALMTTARTLDLGIAQVEMAATHDGDRVGLLSKSPPAPALGATHDRDRPAGCLAADHRREPAVLPPASGDSAEDAGEVGAEGMRQIGEHRVQIPERDGLVGSLDPLGELVQRQPAVAT